MPSRRSIIPALLCITSSPHGRRGGAAGAGEVACSEEGGCPREVDAPAARRARPPALLREGCAPTAPRLRPPTGAQRVDGRGGGGEQTMWPVRESRALVAPAAAEWTRLRRGSPTHPPLLVGLRPTPRIGPRPGARHVDGWGGGAQCLGGCGGPCVTPASDSGGARGAAPRTRPTAPLLGAAPPRPDSDRRRASRTSVGTAPQGPGSGLGRAPRASMAGSGGGRTMWLVREARNRVGPYLGRVDAPAARVARPPPFLWSFAARPESDFGECRGPRDWRGEGAAGARLARLRASLTAERV